MVTLATWTRVLAWEQVARLFHCAWGTVATAVDEAVAYGLAHRDLEGVTHIGIDEISRKRGHVYVTNVYDLQDKRLLWSGEGCGFRAKPITDSGASRSLIPIQADHRFRTNPISDSGPKPITFRR